MIHLTLLSITPGLQASRPWGRQSTRLCPRTPPRTLCPRTFPKNVHKDAVLKDMPKDVPKDMPRDAMQREAVPKDAVPREAMPKDSDMKGGRGSPTRAPPRRQRPRNQPIRRPCTWSLPRDCHSQSGERRQGSQVCRTWCCQEHWLVELDNADKQSVAACEADEMKALKLGNKARMALIWGSSRWAIKLRASQGSKDEKGFFTLMGVPMKRSLPCRGGSSGNATEGAPAGG